MLPPSCWRSTAEDSLRPLQYIENWLWGWYDVERWRTCPSFFKVTYPKFWTSEFPLRVSAFLKRVFSNFKNTKPRTLTEISWYEWFIMAIRRFINTTILITEYVPNMSIPQNLVNDLMPSSSKLSKSMSPNTAQKRVWVVSKRLLVKN